MENKSINSLIGLAMRAGKVKSGEFSTEKSVKSGKAAVVIITEDASLNTRKKFTDMCVFYQVPLLIYGTREMLGHSIGKEYRVSLSIEDAGFYKAIKKHIDSAGDVTEVDICPKSEYMNSPKN